MIQRITNQVGNLVWIVIVAVASVILIASLLLTGPQIETEPSIFQITLDAASTNANAYFPTLAANLTLTPADAALTQAAPTLQLAGQLEVRQYAAAAQASSEQGLILRGAVQAAGPPNTEECGPFETAWGSGNASGTASITLLFAELVTPTGIQIYETFSPGFITQIDFVDHLGVPYTIYQGQPELLTICPFTRVIPIVDADFKGQQITIYFNQSGRRNMIDAVELIGIKHN